MASRSVSAPMRILVIRLSAMGDVAMSVPVVGALRKQYPVFVEGDFTLLEAEHPCLFVYRRTWQGKALLVVCNFSGKDTPWQLPKEWKDGELLLSNYPQHSGTLLPWEAKILYLNN